MVSTAAQNAQLLLIRVSTFDEVDGCEFGTSKGCNSYACLAIVVAAVEKRASRRSLSNKSTIDRVLSPVDPAIKDLPASGK